MTFIAPERTTTDRFILRRWQAGDGPALAAATNASYEHLAPWMTWARSDQSDLEAERTVRRAAASYLVEEDFALAVFDPTETRVLGGSGFHLREGPLESKQAEIGMWIGANHAGHGLGTAVLREMLRWGFERWGFERLSWRCDTQNLASVRCAEKAGMVREGVLRWQHDPSSGGRRDTLCLAALAREWS